MQESDCYKPNVINLKELFSYNGCYTRKQYWVVSTVLFFLFAIVSLLMLFLIDEIENDYLVIAVGLFMIANWGVFLFMSICVSIKRFHDIGKSGYWFFISFIPYVGSIIVLIMNGFLASKKENNRFCCKDEQSNVVIENQDEL